MVRNPTFADSISDYLTVYSCYCFLATEGEPGPSGQEPELPPTPPTRKRRRLPRSFLFANPELPDDHPANIAGVVYQPPAQAPQAPLPVFVEASAPSANSSVATTPEGHIYLDSPQHLGRRRRTGN